MEIIPIAKALLELAIWGILLWYICEFIALPLYPKRVVQFAIFFIAFFTSLQIMVGSPSSPGYRSLSTPSILAPERR